MPTQSTQADILQTSAAEPAFASPDGLRAVLVRLARRDAGGWSSPVGTELLRFAQRRYAPLARSWGRPVEDVAAAAFEVMRLASTVRARDPWAVVTRAVELSLAADAHAERMLISPEHARRPDRRPEVMPARTGEHTEALTALAPAPPPEPGADRLVSTCTVVLAVAGWPVDLASDVTWWLADRIADLGSQASALDVLRRDALMPRRFGLTGEQWVTLLYLLIGTPTSGDPGLIVRVLVGEPISLLLADAGLLEAAATACPALERATP